MSADADHVGSSPKSAKRKGGLFRFCRFLSLGLPIYLFGIFAFGLIFAFYLTDQIYPTAIETYADRTTATIARQIVLPNQQSDQFLQLMEKYHLSWCYLVGKSGKVALFSQPYAPNLKPGKSSQIVKWNGLQYYDSVQSVGAGQYLHAGYSLAPLFAAFAANWTMLSLPPLYFPILLGIFSLFSIAALFFSVSCPLLNLGQTARVLMSEEQGKVTSQLKSHLFGIFEIQELSEALRDLRADYDQLIYDRITKEHELKKQKQTVEQERQSISQSFQEHVLTTQKQITELTTREIEEDFLSSLVSDIDMFTKPAQFAQRVLEKCNDRFPNSITHAAFLRPDKNQKFKVESSIGLNDEEISVISQQNYASIIGELFASNKVIVLDKRELDDLQLYKNLPSYSFVNFLPLVFEKKSLGFIAIYCDGEVSAQAEYQRILRKIAPLCSQALHRIITYQRELEGARTDALTGLHNKKYFLELAPEVLEKCGEYAQGAPVSFLMIDGDHFKQINDSYGHQIGDKMLQELAATIRQCTRLHEETGKIRRYRDYLIRFGGEEFLVIMEGVGSEEAHTVAERIRRKVAEKLDWSGCLTQFTVSIGIATYPGDGVDSHELVRQADLALYYVKESLGRNNVCHAAKVPREFRTQKSVAALGGELGVFDPSALLQSLVSARKSGVLTVVGKDGRQLWLLFENGKPSQAKLGNISGDNAIVEFIATFEEGTFHFQETLANKATFDKMLPLNSANVLKRSLDRTLIDAALAQDNLVMAKRTLPNLTTIFHPVVGKELEQNWQVMMQHPEAPVEEEATVMQQIWRKADGKKTLQAIFTEMDNTPLPYLWRAAALLCQNRILSQTNTEENDPSLSRSA